MLKEIIDKLNRLDADARMNKEKARKYDDVKKELEAIKVGVEKAFSVFDEQSGQYNVTVVYSIQPQTIVMEGDEAALNKTVRALNVLGLVSVKDMNKIMDACDIAKRMNNG